MTLTDLILMLYGISGVGLLTGIFMRLGNLCGRVRIFEVRQERIEGQIDNMWDEIRELKSLIPVHR